MGRQFSLNPVAVFGAVVFWGWLWGIPGALPAVPILTAMSIVCANIDPVAADRGVPTGLSAGTRKSLAFVDVTRPCLGYRHGVDPRHPGSQARVTDPRRGEWDPRSGPACKLMLVVPAFT